MGEMIEAVYEHGVFKPLQSVRIEEGQRVALSVEPMAMALEQAQAELSEWRKVYEGLSEQEIAEVEEMALDRSNFFRRAESEERY